MPISRRKFLAAGVASASAPLLAACATDLSRFQDQPLPALAERLEVCRASYVILDAGRPLAAREVSGCSLAPSGPSIYQAASLTKPVTARVALKLVGEGRLDLQAPVSRYLPGGYSHRQHPFDPRKAAAVDRVPADTLARIPVATLLNHSSGLPNWTSGPLAPEFAPGAGWQYSGEGYTLLQAVITAILGEDFETAVTRAVFQPLGMAHSALRLTESTRTHLVDGSSGFQVAFGEPNGAASLYTTAEDYGKLMAALLADASLLALTVAQPVTVDPELGLTWGYGWGIETTPKDRYLWHWGNNPGYRAFAMASLATRKGFVLLTNSEQGLALAASLAHAVLPDEHRVFRFHMLG